MDNAPPLINVAVCICTRNRPKDLARALDSVEASGVPVSQVIVSDDSTDDLTRRMIESSYPGVDFIEGPRKGLCENRNRALRAVRCERVLFIDDDAVLGHDFISHVAAALEALPADERGSAIVTGVERQGQRIIFPSDQTFFGFQERAYRGREPINTVVINATVFPTALFLLMGFDRNLIYGCDEVDLTTRAVATGYRIVLCPQAINDHYPSPVNRDMYRPRVHASRLYVTFKRYAVTHRNVFCALAYAVFAPVHLCVTLGKGRGLAGVAAAVASVVESVRYMLRYLRQRPDIAAIGPR